MVNRPAFSLTEVVIAMLLLAVAALGTTATSLLALKNFALAEQQETAVMAAQQLLDSLLQLPANRSGTRTIGPTRISWAPADTTHVLNIEVHLQNGITFQLSGQR